MAGSEPPLATWVLDRIEDRSLAVLVSADGVERTVSVELLPSEALEGMVLRAEEGRFVLDLGATEARRKRMEERRASIRRGPSGPVAL